MLIGLTGNFGTGKSTVLEMFRKAGAPAIDSDRLVQTLYDRHEIKEAVATLLGNVLDPSGNLDRQRIAEIIFTHPEMRNRLERFIHPHVLSLIKEFALDNTGKPVIAEIPLLFEGGYEDSVDIIIVTTCPPEQLHKRLLAKGFSAAQIQQRLSCQIPGSEKISKADFVIDTNKNIEDLRNEVQSIYNSLKNSIAKEAP